MGSVSYMALGCMSPDVTNQMADSSLGLIGWKSWIDRGPSLLVSSSFCFPQDLVVPAISRCTQPPLAICYIPVRALDKGTLDPLSV